MGRWQGTLEDMALDAAFWRGRRVLLTGHTGFKGTWLALWLEGLGATVTGFAHEPDTAPSLFRLVAPRLASVIGDLGDRAAVARVVAESRPEIVIHMAAQALVRRSYADPLGTFASNVTGTAHLLDTLRAAPDLRAVLVVTSDKVYLNRDQGADFREDDALGGADPYSASKSAAEMVVAAWAQSFFAGGPVRIGTARAGNVIGGGDWAADRVVPDAWRAVMKGDALLLRYPESTRPWQHVLDSLNGYLVYAQALAAGGVLPAALNFGPDPGRTASVAALAEALLAAWGGLPWRPDAAPSPPEKKRLSLDPSLATATLGWRTRLPLDRTIAWTAEWYAAFRAGAAARELCLRQIGAFQALG